MFPERAGNRVREAVRGSFLRALCSGVKPFDLPEPCWEIDADVQPWRLATAAAGQWRSLSSTGPSRGIPEIHLPMRERSDSSGSALSALAGGTGSGIDSGGTG